MGMRGEQQEQYFHDEKESPQSRPQLESGVCTAANFYHETDPSEWARQLASAMKPLYSESGAVNQRFLEQLKRGNASVEVSSEGAVNKTKLTLDLSKTCDGVKQAELTVIQNGDQSKSVDLKVTPSQASTKLLDMHVSWDASGLKSHKEYGSGVTADWEQHGRSAKLDINSPDKSRDQWETNAYGDILKTTTRATWSEQNRFEGGRLVEGLYKNSEGQKYRVLDKETGAIKEYDFDAKGNLTDYKTLGRNDRRLSSWGDSLSYYSGSIKVKPPESLKLDK